MLTKERRRFPRSNISFPIECNGSQTCGYFYTVCKDMSEGGLKIITDRFIPRNSQVKICINLIDHVVNLMAKVCWCNKIRVSERYSAGLQIIEANKDVIDSISRFLSKISIPAA